MTRQKLILFYWLPIPFLLGFGFLSGGSIDINVHDIYFIADHLSTLLLLSIFLFISGLGYFLDSAGRANKFLLNIQFWHYLIGISSFLLLLALQLMLEWDSSTGEIVEYQNLEALIKIYLGQIASLGMVLIGFLVYLINMVGFLIKKLKGYNP